MANIGNFKKTDKELKGEIITLSVQTKNVRIVPEAKQSNEYAPTHRIFVAPIFANLIEDEGGKTLSLIWSRQVKSANDRS